MTQEKMSPLRQRMIEDMRIRGMGDKHQQSHIRAIKDFAAFLGHSPDTATPEELRGYQLHMADTGVSPSTFNTRIVALRFFFGMTCGREEMKRYMQFRTEPRFHLGQAHGRRQEARNISHITAQLCHTPAGGQHRCARDPGTARSRQADDHRAIYSRGHQDDQGHGQPLRDAGQAAGSDGEAKPGVTGRRSVPAQAGDR